MNAECIAAMRALEEGTVSREAAVHIAGCPACRTHRALLDVLAELPPDEAGGEEVAALMRSLPHARWQLLRVRTWVPAALGVSLVAGGLALLGGVPASGAVPPPGSIAGTATGWAAAWMADVLTLLHGSAGAVSALVAAGGVGLLAWLGATGVGGGWLVYELVRQRPGGRR